MIEGRFQMGKKTAKRVKRAWEQRHGAAEMNSRRLL